MPSVSERFPVRYAAYIYTRNLTGRCSWLDGFLGAQSSRLRCLPIAECTLALGRTMLLDARRMIEMDDGRDTPNLPHTRALVIYGDTDSVFVKYEGLDVVTATAKAKAAAAMVTRRLGRKPILLEFEKCYRTFCIQQIKRYAGAIVDEHSPDTVTEIDIKGFESQQRDTPPFISFAGKLLLLLFCICGDIQARHEGWHASACVTQTCGLL
jgi:DNA polymerase elongation subunit (family B)